jgi:guanine nucleotide-binding protein subunit alpha
MTEALMLFEQISNSAYFTKSALLLFLNKMDLFREKLLISGANPIHKYFPDYQGSPTDVVAAQEFFAIKFRSLLKTTKEVYVHYTNATDTDLLKKTMDSVQDMIVQRNLNTLIL